jgi:hypothetical protein
MSGGQNPLKSTLSVLGSKASNSNLKNILNPLKKSDAGQVGTSASAGSLDSVSESMPLNPRKSFEVLTVVTDGVVDSENTASASNSKFSFETNASRRGSLLMKMTKDPSQASWISTKTNHSNSAKSQKHQQDEHDKHDGSKRSSFIVLRNSFDGDDTGEAITGKEKQRRGSLVSLSARNIHEESSVPSSSTGFVNLSLMNERRKSIYGAGSTENNASVSPAAPIDSQVPHPSAFESSESDATLQNGNINSSQAKSCAEPNQQDHSNLLSRSESTTASDIIANQEVGKEIEIEVEMGTKVEAAANDEVLNPVSSLWSKLDRGKAIYPFEPRSEDELSLQVDDIVLLGEIGADGWAWGENLRTWEKGWFPLVLIESLQQKAGVEVAGLEGERTHEGDDGSSVSEIVKADLETDTGIAAATHGVPKEDGKGATIEDSGAQVGVSSTPVETAADAERENAAKNPEGDMKHSVNNEEKSATLQESSADAPTSSSQPVPDFKLAIALYNFTPDYADGLAIQAQDQLVVIQENDEWCWAQNLQSGMTGWIPRGYFEYPDGMKLANNPSGTDAVNNLIQAETDAPEAQQVEAISKGEDYLPIESAAQTQAERNSPEKPHIREAGLISSCNGGGPQSHFSDDSWAGGSQYGGSSVSGPGSNLNASRSDITGTSASGALSTVSRGNTVSSRGNTLTMVGKTHVRVAVHGFDPRLSDEMFVACGDKIVIG